MSETNKRLLLFIGSYAEVSDPGVYVFEMDPAAGQFRRLDAAGGMKNPTFINVDPEKGLLYAISEGKTGSGERTGEVVAFSIDPLSGKLSEKKRIATIQPSTSHIQRDGQGKFLAVSGYHGGNVGLIRLTEEGMPDLLTDERQHEGHGADPIRQDRPHPHSAWFTPDNRYMLVADLGLDLVRTYALDETKGTLAPQGNAATPPASGPRHLAFHPNGRFAFSINEVGNSVTAYAFDAGNGSLKALETISTLPDGFEGENTTAEIAVSKDGRYLYGSNRGHDSIVQFRIDQESGKLTKVNDVSAEGGHPRHFALTPDGEYAIVANRDSNNLVLFRIDKDSGKWQFTGHTAEVSKPVCVQPVWF